MKSSDLKGIIKKGDLIIISSVMLCCILWFSVSFAFAGGEKQVNIYSDGKLSYSFSLSSVKEQTVSVNSCLIKVTKDGACFLSSDCPDGLCVKRGMMTKAGDVMACVPKGVTVEIRADRNNIDGITF